MEDESNRISFDEGDDDSCINELDLPDFDEGI